MIAHLLEPVGVTQQHSATTISSDQYAATFIVEATEMVEASSRRSSSMWIQSFSFITGGISDQHLVDLSQFDGGFTRSGSSPTTHRHFLGAPLVSASTTATANPFQAGPTRAHEDDRSAVRRSRTTSRHDSNAEVAARLALFRVPPLSSVCADSTAPARQGPSAPARACCDRHARRIRAHSDACGVESVLIPTWRHRDACLGETSCRSGSLCRTAFRASRAAIV